MSKKQIILQKNSEHQLLKNQHQILKNILWSFYKELLFYLLFELIYLFNLWYIDK